MLEFHKPILISQKYLPIDRQFVSSGAYKIVPIRMIDRYDIMQWRNDQIYHLRQPKPLTIADQNDYFEKVVAKLFDQEMPSQILFSYLENEKCIGYGGLVHINWVDRNAEVSFIMNTALEVNFFGFHWKMFLSLLEKIAFEDLYLHKIYTWAFDIRKYLYPVLLSSGFSEEARLKEHSRFENKYLDVLIHSKFNGVLELAKVTEHDLETTFRWATDKVVRNFSFSKAYITFDEHKRWFLSKINNPDCVYVMLKHTSKPIGTIRFDITDITAIISYLVDPEFHGQGYGTKLLKFGEEFLKHHRPEVAFLKGIILIENSVSIKLFEKLGYIKADASVGSVSFIKQII